MLTSNNLEEQCTIVDYLNFVRTRWKEGRFWTGDCHTLAMALHEATGGRGTLMACLVGQNSYSHMVFQGTNESSWDIHGEEAQSRWDAKLASPGRWVVVPSVEAAYKDTKRWLRAHGAALNTPLQRKLVNGFTSRL